MDKEKRLNPYQRLLQEIRGFCTRLKYRKRKQMWYYPKNDLNGSWALGDLYERIKAADQLGYDVELKATDDGLSVQYVERVNIPFMWD